MNYAARRSVSSALLAAVALTAALHAQGTPIGFEETYALSPDRSQAVATLLPGSADWFYWHCRERLDARDFVTVRDVLPQWIQRHGRSERVVEIENRDALLSAGDDAERTFSLLRGRLSLQFDHQRAVPGATSDLPTRLDPERLSASNLRRAALGRSPETLNEFTDAALPALAAETLNLRQLHSLLNRLSRPDLDNLPALVVRDLEQQPSSGFGSLEIHRQLRLEQLEECVRLRPALLQQPRFVEAVLVRLAPDADIVWSSDPVARLTHLQRLHEFAQRLPSSFNSLKAHVLHWWLRHDLTQGAPDKQRFLAYVRLPRRDHTAAEAHRRRFQRSDEHVDLRAAWRTGFDPIGSDQALVRACLEHFFASEDSHESYAEWLDADWCKTVLAETKLLLGQGDPQRWHAMLGDSARIDALKNRVEIGFPATMREHWGADDAVTIAVDVKNVPTLLVKVFAIDAFRYHQEKQRPVDASIELDGVVANFEQTHTYDEPAIRRVRRTFDLPMLREPGTWVVEFVGNGISSRAVVHKGGLRAVERTAAAGQIVRVYDEAGRHVPDAAAWLGSREYVADKKGEILVPFTTEPGDKQLVLRAGNRSSLAPFAHRAEGYELHAGIFVERESLVAGRTARIVVRPQLRLGDRDVAIALLTNRRLVLVATDLDGLTTTKEVRDPTLLDTREFVHEIQVPERLQSLAVALHGTVKDLAGKDVVCSSATASFPINGIDASPETGAPVLRRTSGGYEVELRGKNGEPLAGRSCLLRLWHRDYRDAIQVALQTDAEGRIQLGELPGILDVQVTRHGGTLCSFALAHDAVRWPASLHGLAGAALRLPCATGGDLPPRLRFSLLGHRHDHFRNLAILDGAIELRELPPGDYTLHDHLAGAVVPVRITAGTADGEWLVGRDRVLRTRPAAPIHVKTTVGADGDVVLRLTNFSADTRVHVVATRTMPAFPLFAHLDGVPGYQLTAATTERLESSYHSGRRLGDEYRYVLERRFAPKFAGNLLARPTLLLNPWQVDDSTNAAVGLGGSAGGRYGGRGRRGGGPAAPAPTPASPGGGGGAGTFASFDWLPAGAAALTNLVPDANGTLTVRGADLADGQHVHVLVLDGDQAVYVNALRNAATPKPRARTLARALDGAQHFVEQRRIDFVAAGATTRLADARQAQAEVHDSLAGAHRLLATVSRDAEFARFAFLTTWPERTAEEKAQLYRQYACHELHFFLWHKDRAFFDAVVRPFVLQKLDKTFLDHWLLGDDLTRFTAPWEFAQLNLIERILLSRRLDEAGREAVARAVREALALRPTDVVQLNRLFDLALSSEQLEKVTATRGLLAFAEADPRGDVQLKSLVAPSGPATGGLPAPEAAAKAPADRPGAADDKEKKDATRNEEAARAGAEVTLGETLSDELQQRGQAQRLYRAVEPTKLLVESNWWHRRLAASTPDVVTVNRFWVDYANAPANQPFVSPAFVEANGSCLEMLMALAVLDLPFVAGKHEITADGDARTLKAASPLLLVRKEVTAAERAADQAPLLLGQNFFRLDDRYRVVDGERVDAFVTDEFVVDVAYGCQVVVTNPTSKKRTAEVLLQIPAGAIPVQKGFWQKGVPLQLEPYATATVEYAFYFPGPGSFAHYPAHAAEKGSLAAHAEPKTLAVVASPTKIDATSWEHVSQQGSAADVLAFLDTHNVHGLDLSRIAWRMQDREFFLFTLQRLRSRHAYDHTLWSYGILHRDPASTREHLQHDDGFVATCGMALQSPLLTFEPKERRAFEHVELDPLVHPRAHRLGSQRVIGNDALAQQYRALMTLLGYHSTLSADDWLVVTYYLALQDRIDEALAAFTKVDATKVAARIQYDYLAAWLCFCTGETQKARTLAGAHKDHPVLHWQQRFRDVLAQLDEAEGKTPTRSAESPDLAAQAPALELAIEGKTLTIAHQNLARCEVRYYELDVEFAFSARPFAGDGGTSAAFVRPNLREEKELTGSQTALPLPAQFHQKNVLVEVRGGGLVRSRTYFANALDVRFLESFGQVAVTAPDTKAPLPKTYVKVFARLPGGQVRFHKDGYTDLRGRFDYASLSDDPNAAADRYAVLVLDEQRGAVIREIAPPAK